MSLARWQQGWQGHLLAALSGAIAVLAFSPFDLWLFAPLSSALLYYLLHNLSPKRAAWRGTFYGFGLFGAGTSWIYVSIHEFGAASTPLAAFLTLLFCLSISLIFITPFAYLYAKIRQKSPHSILLSVVGFISLWVLFEWWRSWIFTGFPWLLWGYALLDSPFSSGAPIAGVYGLSLLTVSGGALLGQLFIHRGITRPFTIMTAIYCCTLLGTFLLDSKSWVQPTSSAISVVVVQPNIPQDLKWREGYLQNTLEKLESLTEPHWGADIIVWPENAIPALYHRIQPYLNSLTQQAQQTQSSLITGIPFYEKERGEHPAAFYNGITSLGLGAGNYYKQKLVPFGEYVPLQSVLRGIIKFFDLPMSDFARGPENQDMLLANGNRIAPLICYEIVYPDLVAGMSQQADILLTISNDTWFGASIGPHQHLQMARMRALENGRYLMRGTNDGISAFIDPYGKIMSTLPQFEEGSLRDTVYRMSGQTPFTRTGSWPLIVFLIAGLALTVIASRRAGTVADRAS